MPEPYRLKLKIGQHEFEAEGDPQVVHEQFQLFKELILMQPVSASVTPANQFQQEFPASASSPKPEQQQFTDLDLSKILRQDSRVISLTIRPSSIENGILLILLGQKFLRSNDAVTGSEIIDGLAATGGVSVQRPDRNLEKLARDGDVIAFGERRGKRYRLTNTGLAKARSLAAELIATVA